MIGNCSEFAICMHNIDIKILFVFEKLYWAFLIYEYFDLMPYQLLGQW